MLECELEWDLDNLVLSVVMHQSDSDCFGCRGCRSAVMLDMHICDAASCCSMKVILQKVAQGAALQYGRPCSE